MSSDVEVQELHVVSSGMATEVSNPRRVSRCGSAGGYLLCSFGRFHVVDS